MTSMLPMMTFLGHAGLHSLVCISLHFVPFVRLLEAIVNLWVVVPLVFVHATLIGVYMSRCVVMRVSMSFHSITALDAGMNQSHR